MVLLVPRPDSSPRCRLDLGRQLGGGGGGLLLLLLPLTLLLRRRQGPQLESVDAAVQGHFVLQKGVHHSVPGRLHFGRKGIRRNDYSINLSVNKYITMISIE